MLVEIFGNEAPPLKGYRLMSDEQVSPPQVTPQHKSKAGIAKLIVQSLALIVAIVNEFWDTGYTFNESNAAIVVGVLESLWQGKQQVKRRQIRKLGSPQNKEREKQ